MSIATLARKSRAQRGASTRTGWTLATTKSGNCPNPCGGGAPAKQQSFRRLMKNKEQGGGPNPGGTNNDASGGDCCFTTWKKTNDPKGEQSIGYYLWRKKQLTHNCIRHCIPHREHYNTNYIYITWTGTTAKNLLPPYNKPNTPYQFYPSAPDFRWAPVGVHDYTATPHIYWDTGSWYADAGNGVLTASAAQPASDPDVRAFPPKSGWKNALGALSSDLQIAYGTDPALPPLCFSGPCDNVGCKCDCNKSMGGTACCVVHKTMLPLSNSENIAWVVEDRTCLQTSKPAPRNPNTC